MEPDIIETIVREEVVIVVAVYGDNCSPISDTTILSSLVCGADHMDHVITQMPLA